MNPLLACMRRLPVLLLVLIPLVAPLAASRTILVLGDSLSAAFGFELRQGWVAQLEQRLARDRLDYAVINASVSGDTSANGLARLPALLQRHRPGIVIVALGGNDGLRGLPPEQIKHNIVAIVKEAKAVGAKVVLVGVPLPPNYGRQYIERFRRIYREIASEHNVPLVPSLVDGVAGDRVLMQPDGIHPTAQAQPRMLENVWVTLRQLL
jgi:acyl-CoA thioesterase-1